MELVMNVGLKVGELSVMMAATNVGRTRMTKRYNVQTSTWEVGYWIGTRFYVVAMEKAA